MALFLDSASLDEARQAASYGYVTGCTTNPALLARAGHADAHEALRALCALFHGPVFYQLLARSVDAMRPEAGRFLGIAPNLGLKIPCTLEGLRFANEMRGRAKIAITGVFNPSQAYLAAQAGSDYVIPYVNRVTRFTGDGPGLIGDLVELLEPTECEVLAAGIKSASEAVDVLLAGAQHVSLPLEVIHAMAENPLTQKAMEDFEAAWAQPR